MATEPLHNRPVVLRTVRREPPPEPKEAPKIGLDIACPAEMTCPHCQAAVPLAQATPLATLLCPACGSTLFVPGRLGWFLLRGHVGEGQMGTVYRATDESLGREVAIKLVRGSDAEDPASRERLRSEACAAGKLNHPRVAQVYALMFSNGHPYLVMELVSGQDFAQMLDDERRLDERAVLNMALDVAEGLSALKREGLVHGDIKPGNIVLGRDGHAKLVDFGLSGTKRTDSKGKLVGTPNYIAPELLRGAADTHRSDIYSLGATLYHLMVGRPPAEGEKTIDILKARLLGTPIPLHKVAGHLSTPTKKLLMRMLEHDPSKRASDSDVVAAEIREALAKLDKPAAGDSDTPFRFFSRVSAAQAHSVTASRRRRRAAAAAIAVLGASAALAFAFKDRLPAEATWLHGGAAAAPEYSSATTAPDERREPAPAHSKVRPSDLLSPATALSATDLTAGFTAEAALNWQCASLGDQALHGSTMQRSGTLIIQSTGTEMSKGLESYRYVWSKASGDYAFSAQVQAIADNAPLAISGLLVKGPDPACGPALFFGFLGSGELLLQLRQPQGKPQIVRRSELPVKFPCALRVSRHGNLFEAAVSSDGRTWRPFAARPLNLPPASTVGFVVSPSMPGALATAKFAGVRLLTPGLAGTAPTNAVPSTALHAARPSLRGRI